jgi:hypothetical protein
MVSALDGTTIEAALRFVHGLRQAEDALASPTAVEHAAGEVEQRPA